MPQSEGSDSPSLNSPTTSLEQQIPGAFPDQALARFSTQQSLSQAIYARRAEYTRPKRIRIKVGTWNVASFKGTEHDIGGWFVGGKGVTEALAGLSVRPQSPEDAAKDVSLDRTESVDDQERRRCKKESTIPKNDPGTLPGGEDVDLYAIGLQEIVDINSAAEALRPYTDPAPANRFKTAIKEALPPGYKLVAEQQLIGLLLLVYASPSLAPDVKSVSTTSVGTGLGGYMGNKGAVTARLLLGDTTRLVFIDSHLSAGADKGSLDRRNWDAGQITSRTRFDAITDPAGVSTPGGESIGDADFAFWFGDLNYRLTGMPGEDVRRLLMLHTKNEYDEGKYSASKVAAEIEEATVAARSRASSDQSSSSDTSAASSNDTLTNIDSTTSGEEFMLENFDPASLQTTIECLLPHDELYEVMKHRRAFHDGWREAPIKFLPTYKYDVGSVGVFDSSEKKRCPSWCDRILYRTRRDKLEYEQKLRDEAEAKQKDEEWKARGIDEAAADDGVLFDYDPDEDGDEYDEFADTQEQIVTTKEGFEDEISLEYYTSHQRVLSSDHKPLDAIFSLKYESAVPELKAKVHQDCARLLDRAENETRPTVTLIVDHSHDDHSVELDEKDPKFEGVNFGEVKYLKEKSRLVTVANVGQVPASVHFVDRPVPPGNDEGSLPTWLSATFDRDSDNASKDEKADEKQTYTLEPGEACSIRLSLRVSVLETVNKLNSHALSLDDVLVLRVENGRDHFLPIRGQWMQSALGRSIDKLIRIPEGGIRKLQRQKPVSKNPSATTSQEDNTTASTLTAKAKENEGTHADKETDTETKTPS
ncbi:DNase I-like protein [Aulographum hederae CBS 113979]|uniref:DNase I-like protein n=1 Tax=Aulographum hederae CBS 113979 TaxID=1176131 RepID=A0A6G1GZ48_9PEZI|nr:DNase I-like protein [Aulographum hederae CBS 113979]